VIWDKKGFAELIPMMKEKCNNSYPLSKITFYIQGGQNAVFLV
jgi:hypothetical protein